MGSLYVGREDLEYMRASNKMTTQEKLHEANQYIERQKEYISELENENQLLYGRLNKIRELTHKEVK